MYNNRVIDDIINMQLLYWEYYADDVNELVNTTNMEVNKAIKLVLNNYPSLLPN